jgi:hypothetical protein
MTVARGFWPIVIVDRKKTADPHHATATRNAVLQIFQGCVVPPIMVPSWIAVNDRCMRVLAHRYVQ